MGTNFEYEWVVYYYLKPFYDQPQTKWRSFKNKECGEVFVNELKKNKDVIKIEPIRRYKKIYLECVYGAGKLD